MPDMEKVIGNLTSLMERLKWQKDIQGYGVYISFVDDAIDLLKEQEEKMKHLNNITLEYEKEVFRLQTLLKEQDAVEPTIDEYGNKRCGSCGHKLQSIADPDLFCCKCGKPVLWEGR